MSRPGVHMSMSTLLEPPRRLYKDSFFIAVGAEGFDRNIKMTDCGDLSATSLDCSCANECCPVAVPVPSNLQSHVYAGRNKDRLSYFEITTPSDCLKCFPYLRYKVTGRKDDQSTKASHHAGGKDLESGERET